jgi:uncharacterized protein (DUF2062 family)
MLFRRRKPLDIRDRMLGWLWPKTGFRRAFTYLKQRLIRLPGSDYSLAVGFTCGVVVSFTPFVGFHFLLAGLLTWMLRGNVLVSAVATLVGNPWTFPLFWLASLRLGRKILYQFGLTGGRPPAELQEIWLQPLVLMVPWAVGSVALMVLVGLPLFGVSYWVVSAWRRAMRLRRAQRRSKAGQAHSKTSQEGELNNG